MAHSAGSPDKGMDFSESQILTCGSKQLDLSNAVVMGILNLTPDSFYDGGQHNNLKDFLKKSEQMIREGAAILDLGAVSTRPGAPGVSEEEEARRLMPAIEAIVKEFPETVISVDTYRAAIAVMADARGVGIINDISGGTMDTAMFDAVGSMDAAYVLMHMQGTPETMQTNPEYGDVVNEINEYFAGRLSMLLNLGKRNVILDPGFGFGKTLADNFRILNSMDTFLSFGCPMLAGLSRKSMINKVIGTTPDQALNGTSVLNTISLMKGAKILRVHDVKQAMEAIKLVGALLQSTRNN